MSSLPYRTSLSLLILAAVFGCGGGGSDSSAPITTNPPPGSTTPPDNSGGNQPPGGTPSDPPPTGTTPEPVAAGTAMTMSCPEGAGTQCSGERIIRIDNGISLTSSGVQSYGISTNDLVVPSPQSGSAFGLALRTGGTAEARVSKNAAGEVSNPTLLLNNFGISWDGTAERPPIIETFATSQRRVSLAPDRTVTFGPLPDASDIGFYDYAVRKEQGTQAHYANNVYFPRTNYPVRCPADNPDCPSTETDGLKLFPGDWRSGGNVPDTASTFRLHADGDLFAGDDVPGPNGERRYLPGGDGFGVSYPGFKGYRTYDNWGYQYGNLGAWVTMDTVNIVEFAGNGNEHNKNRRGTVAFGDVTDPAAVPTTGSATYAGYAYGWYSRNGTEEAIHFYRGNATLVVDFQTRRVAVTFANTVTFNEAMTPVPVTLTGTVPMGAAGANTANYLTGTVSNGTFGGGLSGRYFGPVVATGSSGPGPAEVGGSFSLSNASTGAATVGGFIGRKQ
jgi:hypothetical protein